MDLPTKVIAQFKARDADTMSGPPFEIPLNITPSQLELLINNVLSNEESLPYSFFVGDVEVKNALSEHLATNKVPLEQKLTIIYEPQAVFRVRAVTRCSSSMPGHSEAVLSVCFSPDGGCLASGSGDTSVRIWDIDTETPKFTCKAHKNWVLCISFSPNGKYIVSGDMDGDIYVWDPETGNQIGSVLKGHKKFITGISWEPLHKNPKGDRFASSSKDATVKIWDISLGRAILTLSGHTASVTCLRWGGMGLIYTGSQDRTIRVHSAVEGKLCRVLEGHSHWVNSLALHTDHVLRTGSFDHTGKVYQDPNEAQQYALTRYNTLRGKGGERLASCSDDYTIYLWDGENSKKPIIRMTGHQQPINLISFSPDGRLVASASFDKSLKIWDGVTGKFKASLRGHVGAVYQVCWSSDSRMLVSGSKDSTVKLWDLATNKLKVDMPGHADEVYSVDWSPDGQRVASGSKDRTIKIWRH
eukprot:Phypoly_transcript_08130.p1 GENE.Phypoly_transcript_08130~~Phypoly_transcript_08130.p1  ORF type:complete len:471 (+),score=19.98 Phypoly_transcript_08130:59-1471(+)